MKLKQVILQVLDRDGLKAVADGLEIEVADRRSTAGLTAALSRSRRATPESMLEYLNERAVKTVCEVYGIPSTGRRGELGSALLRAERKAKGRRPAPTHKRPSKTNRQRPDARRSRE